MIHNGCHRAFCLGSELFSTNPLIVLIVGHWKANNRRGMSTSSLTSLVLKIKIYKWQISLVTHDTYIISLFADDSDGFQMIWTILMHEFNNFYLVLKTVKISWIPIFNDKNHCEILVIQTNPFADIIHKKLQTATSILSAFSVW